MVATVHGQTPATHENEPKLVRLSTTSQFLNWPDGQLLSLNLVWVIQASPAVLFCDP